MKKSKKQANIPSLIKSFLLDHLYQYQNASANTVSSYRDVFRIFLEYLQEYHRIKPERITLKDLSVDNVLKFLEYLQKVRKNCINTRNSRLAVIRSFANYLILIDPTWSAELQGVLSIPCKKTNKKTVDYLSQEEMQCLLETPNPNTWTGQRDRVLLMVMYNTGARVSEIVRLKVGDIHLIPKGNVRLFGKGRKERTLPLWKNTTKLLRQWIKTNGYTPEMPLFPSKCGIAMTRNGISSRLETIVQKMTMKMPSLKTKCITPHTIRHTTAMHFLESGIDITVIAMWLGHESIETTQIYVTADMKMKEMALKKLQEPNSKGFRFKPSDSLLAFLENM